MNKQDTEIPIRILHVLNNLGSGGVEGLLMNIYRNIDRDKIQFDFMIRSPKNNRFENEVIRMGGRVFIMPEFPKKIIQNYLAVDKFFSEHGEYKIIHVHANALIYTIPLILAKKHGISCRILHSHNTNTRAGILGRIIHASNRIMLDRWATDLLACSKPAAFWMFGRRAYTLVNNGVDLETYRYSSNARDCIRHLLGVGNELVIGHVGRFLPSKNHPFIIEVFAEVLKLQPNAKLLLIGEGEMSPAIQNRIKDLGIANKIYCTGVVSNVQEYLSAMDVFFFPSLYEGLPLALIEAQANGLPCVISKTIPQDVIISDNIYTLALDVSPKTWAEHLLNAAEGNRIIPQNDKLLAYDIREITRRLSLFYEHKAIDTTEAT